MNQGDPNQNRKVVTRIFVNTEGDIVVTDLWEEVRGILDPSFSLVEDGADEDN